MKLTWDQVGDRLYETGVDKGVLYLRNDEGDYDEGHAWNGLESVTESPSGAEATPTYADNIKYLNLISQEQFGATIEAYTYPEEFAECDGTATPTPGVAIGQQSRRTFGLAYRTKLGNDVSGTDHGYKLHLIYGAIAAPSEKAYATINDTPEALTFSWELSTTPVEVPDLKPTATIVVDSTKVDPDSLAALEEALYGSVGGDANLPLPADVIAMFSGDVVEVITLAPSYNASTDIVTIPAVTGVVYKVDGDVVPSGAFGPITEDTVVTASPAPGYRFSETSDADWTIVHS